MLVMAFKLDVTEVAIQLAVVGTVGYFAITYGPAIMQAVAGNIMGVLGQGVPPTVSGDATSISGGTATCTTGNVQMDQMITSMGMDICQYTGQSASGPGVGMGAGGLGPLNGGIPNYLGSAWQNTGGIPGVLPGTVPGTVPGYPQFTGAPQFQATPLGSAQITCPNGICRSYVGEVINV